MDVKKTRLAQNLITIVFFLITILFPFLVSYHAAAQGAPQGFAGLGEGSPDFEQVSPDTTINFPTDHRAHDGYRIEWWYVTANLTASDGTPMGLQWTLFRNALTPGLDQSQDRGSGWSEPVIWMGHAAVTSPSYHLSAERFGRGGVGQAGVTVDNAFDAWIDDWSLKNANGPSFKTLRATASGERFSYDVMLNTNQLPVLQGDQGYSVKSDNGQASHYYSQPFYSVSGTVTVDGQDVEVTGKAWLDREWSSQFLSGDQTGWDWFSLHLENGEKVMLFQLRGGDGDAFYSGNHILPDGKTQQLSRGAIIVIPQQQTRINGRKVPTGWRVEIPELDLNVTTRAINRKAMMETLFSYWEGPISFSGSHDGVGYLEMTGY